MGLLPARRRLESTPELAAASAAPVDASLEQDTVQLAGGETADLPSKEDLTRHLLFIVSERTGYPTEMLPMDEDIEARLGIDLIKRVEILGALQREYIPADQRIGPEAMEQLTAIKTLQGVVDWFDDALRGVLGNPSPAEDLASSQRGRKTKLRLRDPDWCWWTLPRLWTGHWTWRRDRCF